MHNKTPTLSVVIPLYNEAENIPLLFDSLEAALGSIDCEIVLVDDGSRDGTSDIVQAKAGNNCQLIVFQRNYGQTSALAAGIDMARGEYIATMDGDLQNDPADIPMMLEKLKRENLDIVTGYREHRQDNIFRTFPSRIANVLMRRITGVHVRDSGCTLKLFRAQLAKQLDLYGELHRFIPAMGAMAGARIADVPVRHHPRRFGKSKYGLSRTLAVASDLLLMSFFIKYRQKPMHLFGALGLLMFAIGGIIEAYMLWEKLDGQSIGGPAFYVGILLLIVAMQFITTGFISELLMRTYYESQHKKPYIILKHLTFDGSRSHATHP